MDKTFLNITDLATYTGLSKSYLYKLSHLGKLPAYKPLGKCLFFDIEQINDWIRQNPIKNADELETEANTLATIKSKSKGGLNK